MMSGMVLLMLLGGLAFLAVPVGMIVAMTVLLTQRGQFQNASPVRDRPVVALAQESMAGGRVCPNCGQIPAADWHHCAHCGASLAASR